LNLFYLAALSRLQFSRAAADRGQQAIFFLNISSLKKMAHLHFATYKSL
jgi:hypothetical protein